MNICTKEVASKVYGDYTNAMLRGDYRTCYKIEQDFGLDGYTPEVVLVGLYALTQGQDHYEAIDEFLYGNEDD